jgi:hypothetical protein
MGHTCQKRDLAEELVRTYGIEHGRSFRACAVPVRPAYLQLAAFYEKHGAIPKTPDTISKSGMRVMRNSEATRCRSDTFRNPSWGISANNLASTRP